MSPRQSTLPNNTPLRLPPLSPPLKSHPQAVNNNPLPVVYSLQLPQDVIKTLLSARSATSVRFNNPEAGEIIIPNANPIPFSIHPIADANASTARAACYTRRENSLRTVGPIVADLVVERKLSSSVAATTKKRTLEARNAGKARDLKLVDDIPVSQPAKRARKKPVEKRPRPMRRPPNITSAPVLPKTTPNPLRLPRSAPTPPSNTPPSFRSPAVSPGHSSGKPNGSTRSTPTRNSFSAMQSRKVSPSSLASTLPKPVSRRTPTKPSHFSPVGSRGPSPSINSPGSPRVASIRPPRIGDHDELRRQLVHFLAMGDNDLRAIKDRLETRRIEFSHQTLTAVLREEVADMKGGKWSLKEKAWADVTEKFEYSSAERAKMRVYRAEAVDVNKSPSDQLKMRGMSDEQLDAAVANFQRGYKEMDERITGEKEEAEMRKTFMDLFPLYKGVMTRMEELQGMFKTLQTRYLAAKNKDEKDRLARRITTNHKKYQGRHMKFEKVLPLLHRRMKRIRRALDDYANCEEDR